MKNKQGFTLLELLIAAAIIGALAIFAVQSFKSTSAEIRLEDAKVRATMVQQAAVRFFRDNPELDIKMEGWERLEEISPRDPHGCTETSPITVQQLVDCGYLEYRQYNAEVREGNALTSNYIMAFQSRGGKDPAVCVKGNTSRTRGTGFCTDNSDSWSNL